MGQTTDFSQEERFVYKVIEQPKLGLLIKNTRKAKKLSQRQVGELVGVSYQTIAYWESGSRSPAPIHLTRLAVALGQPEDFFFSRILQQETKPAVSSLSSNLRQYRKIFGISQAKLSEETGISLARIKAYEDENSGQFITNEDLDILCQRFKTKREQLLGQSATVETMQDMMKSNYLQKIENALKLLNLTGLEKAAERVEEIAEISRYRL